jgi:hypothetical protein
MSRGAWNSHQRSSRNLANSRSKPTNRFSNITAPVVEREFVESASGERWAVYVSVFSFRRLPDHVSTQWLGELCPGAPMPLDAEVRNGLMDHHAK